MSRRTRDQLSSQESSPEAKQIKMADEKEPTMQMIYQLLQSVQNAIATLVQDNKQFKHDIDDLKRSQEYQDVRIEELIKENKELKTKLQTQDQEVQRLSATTRTLENKLEEVEVAQENLNQYNRKFNLIFAGIPERKDEDLDEAIRELGDLLNVTLDESDIDIVHRIHSKTTPRPVIVRFGNYTAKREMYAARKNLKSMNVEKFEETNCLYGAKKIFINENLTPQRGMLFAEVRKRTRLNGWHSTWTLDGKIFIKKNREDRRLYKVEKQADLEDLYDI